MSNNMEDENIQPVEETTPSPSEEIKPIEEVLVEPVEKTVPYDRFKQVINERNQYKELLSVQPAPKQMDAVPDDLTEAIKIVDSRASQIVNQKLEAISRQQDLDKTISNNKDFFQFADAIKAKIQDNPHMTYSDAYKLARYDASISQAKEIGKQEAYRQIESKKAASVETTAKTNPVVPTGNNAIDPLAKGPDGKFLFSTKDLEELLPKSKTN